MHFQGQFSINLIGTGLKVDQATKWTSQGNYVSVKVHRSEVRSFKYIHIKTALTKLSVWGSLVTGFAANILPCTTLTQKRLEQVMQCSCHNYYYTFLCYLFLQHLMKDFSWHFSPLAHHISRCATAYDHCLILHFFLILHTSFASASSRTPHPPYICNVCRKWFCIFFLRKKKLRWTMSYAALNFQCTLCTLALAKSNFPHTITDIDLWSEQSSWSF